MAVDSDQFKAGMRRLAASVNILTSRLQDGTRIGMTATAVCSVSGDPPSLLCCVNRSNATRLAFEKAGIFAVNVLAAGDEDLANRFAMRMEHDERYEEGAWTTLETGAPILETAVAAFDCRITEQFEVGSHTIFIGQVADVSVRGESAMPLLYAHGGYGKFFDSQMSLQDLMWTPDWQDYN